MNWWRIKIKNSFASSIFIGICLSNLPKQKEEFNNFKKTFSLYCYDGKKYILDQEEDYVDMNILKGKKIKKGEINGR